MIKKINKIQMIKRLEHLHSKVESKTSIPMIIDLEKWLNSDDKSSSFDEYVLEIQKKNPNTTIIIDDMILQTNMYIDIGLILNSDRQTLKLFVSLAKQEDEIQYMKSYTELFHSWMGINDLEPKEETIKKLNHYHDKSCFVNGRYLTVEEQIEEHLRNKVKHYEMKIQVAREVLSELSNPFYLDFFDHYKKLTVEELIERYKEQSFFDIANSNYERMIKVENIKGGN